MSDSDQLSGKASHRSYFLTKWTVWEYLPWWLANGPVYCFYAWFALRARHLFFFTNVDPAIPLGGSMGESKHDILRILPAAIVPKTVFVQPGDDFEEVLRHLDAAGIGYPLIAKPDVGERGFLVAKIGDAGTLKVHLERYPVPFIIQEFLTLPVEMSVLFHRFPNSGAFGITSVCIKEFLSVTGDGISSIRALMAQSPRASFQLDRFEREFPQVLNRTPAKGEQILLEPIGNHSRGTKFLNGNHLIDAELEAAFRPVCEALDGILYGRFDLKCASVEALRRGEFKAMELNGVLGEPAHIYDPAFGMWKAYRDLYRHWRLLYRLHRAQKALGVYPTPHGEAFGMIREYFKYKRTLNVGRRAP